MPNNKTYSVEYGDYVAHWRTREAAVQDARYESAKHGGIDVRVIDPDDKHESIINVAPEEY